MHVTPKAYNSGAVISELYYYWLCLRPHNVSSMWVDQPVNKKDDNGLLDQSHQFQWLLSHDDVIKWKHFSRYWPFVGGIHRSPVNSRHTRRPVTRSFDVFFDIRLNKQLSKQPWVWWFETSSWSWWRHCHVTCVAQCCFCDLTVIIKSCQHGYCWWPDAYVVLEHQQLPQWLWREPA